MNVFIFGSSGFIGQHFKNKLETRARVIEFDILNNPDQDVRKSINIEGNCAPGDLIINLAAVHRTPGHACKEYFETNIRGAENVCDFASRAGINNIIFTSSIAPYGSSEEEKTEECLPMPNSPYGISKLTAEYIHRNWQASDPLNRKLLIIRPGVVFGCGENGNFTRLYNSLKQGSFFYPGRTSTLKANIYVKDLVDIALAVNNSFTHGVKLYNFANHPCASIKQIVESICDVTGINKPGIVINGSILKLLATALSKVGGAKLGIHPNRVTKLMVSTNISGKKLVNHGFIPQYGLKGGVEDWYNDRGKKGLY